MREQKKQNNVASGIRSAIPASDAQKSEQDSAEEE